MNPHVAFVSSYPPRECGIATFAYDLRQAIGRLRPESKTSVIGMTNEGMTNGPDGYDYPPEVVFEIRQQEIGDYRLAAEYANLSAFDLTCVQHEFGIYGGSEGRYIAEMMEGLRGPIVSVLHTVLAKATPGYRESLTRVAGLSDHLIVLNRKAVPILQDVYGVAEQKIHVIHHGVPEAPFIDPNYYKDKFNVEGRLVILTFGFLSRNKGIEMMLESLPDVVREHPEVIYIVLGATHPEVKRSQGEEYRLWLEGRVRELGLTDHVLFDPRFVEQEELLEFIGACDIYVTPYQSREQIVSGTLAYAVGMGKAVVSTPYLYAEETLADGRGLLVDFGDRTSLTARLNELIEMPAARHRMRKLAYQYGQQMVWPEVGRRYLEVFDKAVASYRGKALPRSARHLSAVRYSLPPTKVDHLALLTDDTGIIQHAAYGVPDRRFGYSTDDAARAMIVALLHYEEADDDLSLQLVNKYLSFLQHQQLPDGHFHNFMSYSREHLDERGSEDTLGRALWGLGEAVAHGPTGTVRVMAGGMFEKALGVLDLEHPRAMAYAICGLYAFLQKYGGATLARRKLVELADHLAGWFNADSADWQWFGEEMTYANAKMPQAMLLAFKLTGHEPYKQIGLAALDFLIATTYSCGHFDFVGNEGWYRYGSVRSVFSQQPIEAGYTAEACLTAYELTGSSDYFDMACAAAEWLLGRNRLGVRLYESTTGACADGLDPHGPNMNQGAESAICALFGLILVSRQVEKFEATPRAIERKAPQMLKAESAG